MTEVLVRCLRCRKVFETRVKEGALFAARRECPHCHEKVYAQILGPVEEARARGW